MTIIVPAAPGKSADKKRRRGLCITPRCTRPAPAGKGCCRTCQDRKWRARHPEHHLWNNLKKSAKKRGIPFTISLADFKVFCAETNLIARVGKGPDDMTVDREKPERGYEKGNIRVLTNAENGRLGGYLSGSGHRTPGQTSLPMEDAPHATHYTPDEDPLA